MGEAPNPAPMPAQLGLGLPEFREPTFSERAWDAVTQLLRLGGWTVLTGAAFVFTAGTLIGLRRAWRWFRAPRLAEAGAEGAAESQAAPQAVAEKRL